MIGTSLPEWVFIRLSIVFFRYTPLLYGVATAVLLAAYGLKPGPHVVPVVVLLVLLLAEAIYYVSVWRVYEPRLRQSAQHPPPLPADERDALFKKCLTNVPSTEAYLRWWFLGAKLEDIRRENLEEFILWAFFDLNGPSADLDSDLGDVREEVDGYIALVEEHLGWTLKEGRGPAQCLRLTFDDVFTAYRSLLWYAVIFLVDQVTHVAMYYHGFQYYTTPKRTSAKIFPPRPQTLLTRHTSKARNISYWYQPHEGGPGKLPVVFFHGIGVGLWTYVTFLAGVHATRDRYGNGTGLIVVETLPISFRLTAPPLSKAQFLHEITEVIDSHGWEQFAVVSHSYGSVLTTHILHTPALARRIQSVVFIDPVTIMLHLPDVAFNFTRRRPRRANEWQLWYYASTDPGVAHCLGRHFFWRDNIIWKEELTTSSNHGGAALGRRKVAIFLSGQDIIVDTASVSQYLGAGGSSDATMGSMDGIEVARFPGLDHAQVFDDTTSRETVVKLITSYCAS
jgi:pimeloyl-ACP methyl ester carboxylesterase